jgi:hypothetical protein
MAAHALESRYIQNSQTKKYCDTIFAVKLNAPPVAGGACNKSIFVANTEHVARHTAPANAAKNGARYALTSWR